MSCSVDSNLGQSTVLKHVDVEEMRVITNNRYIAEQIKSDKVENVVMGGSKVGKENILKTIVMNGVKIGKVGNWKITELTRRCGAKLGRDCASQS